LGFNREGGSATFWDLEGEMKSRKGLEGKRKRERAWWCSWPGHVEREGDMQKHGFPMACLEEEGQKRSKR
jgi:hypothetical protein